MKRLVIIPEGGLCNRMRFLNSVCEYVKNKKVKVYCLWIKSEDCFVASKDLFSEESFVYSYISMIEINMQNRGHRIAYYIFMKVMELLHFCVHQLDFYHSPKEESKELYEKEKDFLSFFERRYMVIGGCEKLGENLAPNMFLPNKEIKAKLNSVQSNMKLKEKEYVSVHIRRTDHEAAINVSPDILFYKCISEICTNGDKIFLSTDDAILKQKLLTEFSPNVFAQELSSYSRSNMQGIIEAYIDLILLSEGKVIYGSFGSSFSEMAALIGKINLVVVK